MLFTESRNGLKAAFTAKCRSLEPFYRTVSSGGNHPARSDWQDQDKKTLKRINKLIIDVKRSLFEGIGKPEPLKKTQLDSGHAKLKIPIDWFVTSMSR